LLIVSQRKDVPAATSELQPGVIDQDEVFALSMSSVGVAARSSP
jgi:hypothetical protein